MTSDNTQVNANLTQGSKLVFGEQLKTARETLGLSPQDVGARLNLSPRFITMLETEDLLRSNLPPIYLRGYLRSYARLVSIPEKDIASVLEKLEPTPVILTMENIPTDSLSLSFPLQNLPSFSRLGTLFISLLLLTSITAWWYLHSNSPSPTVVTLSQPLNESQNTANNLAETSVENELTVSKATVDSTAATPPSKNTPLQAPSVAINFPNPSQLALAPPSPAPLQPHKVQEEGDENADEQE